LTAAEGHGYPQAMMLRRYYAYRYYYATRNTGRGRQRTGGWSQTL